VRRKRAASAEVLEQLLGESDGLTTAALADRAGADRTQVLTLLKELEAGGRVRRSGVRRATRWRRFTEEDAIAERAAELAAIPKSRADKRRAASG
jgi:DNA-binding IclR family transcriptional regulator